MQRGIDFVSGFVLGRAVGVAGAAEIVHGAGKPGVFNGEEIDVSARDGGELFGQIGEEIFGAEIVEVSDDGRAEGADRGHGGDAIAAPGIDGVQEGGSVAGVGQVAGAAKEFGDAGAFFLGL